MEYKNTKTKVVISTNCVITGGDWVPFDSDLAPDKGLKADAPIQEEPATQQRQVHESAEDTEAFDGITRAQIMQELDAFGVEYDPKTKKQVLYDLMMQQGK
ncbi:hypothetical protein [Enterococcus rotai]|uniref:hypothetical protein n=1 Tax=Enterococcus rotai TaxID=118060 RepID=UPI0032B39DB5